VLVHKEVHEFGMVVDSGCMKCMDCVSTCPEQALYLGFGAPAVAKKARIKNLRPRNWSFTGKEEIALLIVFAATLFILRGIPEPIAPWAGSLYLELTPLLFALGIAATSALVLVLAARSLTQRDVQWQKVSLKRDGHLTRAGKAFSLGALLLCAFLLHSAWIQSLMWRTSAIVERTPPALALAAWRRDAATLAQIREQDHEDVTAALSHLDSAESYGLMADVRIPRERAWLEMVLGRYEQAESALRSAIAMRPHWSNSYQHLGQLLAADGLTRIDEAADLILKAQRLSPEKPVHQVRQSILELLQRGQALECVSVLKALLGRSDLSPKERDEFAHLCVEALSLALSGLDQSVRTGGAVSAVNVWLDLLDYAAEFPVAKDYYRVAATWAQVSPAIVPLLRAAQGARPSDAGLETVFAQSLLATSAFDEAAEVTQRMVNRWPEDAISAFLMGKARRGQGRETEAIEWFRKAHAINPTLPKDGI
jgi:tetratricopeptide (TPR) repeat protein